MRAPDTLLASVPLFAGVAPETLGSLATEAVTCEVLAGDWVFHQGDPADDLYVVVRGRLRVSVEADGERRDLNELGPGAAVGELALLTGSRRSASIRAVRDTALIRLPGAVFAEHLQRDPGLAASVARTLARQVQDRGGLPLPEATPSLLVVRGLGVAPVAAFAESLRSALATLGTVALLSGGEGAEVERAERAHRYVVLLDDESDTAWSALCARQADRTLLVATGGASATAEPHADLVVLGPFEGVELRRLLASVGPRAHHRLATTEPSDPGIRRLARRLVGRSLGVVLSGGGARGLAHVGVLQALEEEGIEVDRYGGCSMGALIAAMASAGWRADVIAEQCRDELVRRSPFNDYTIPRVSLIRARKAERMLTRLFGELTIEELARPLFTVSADLLSSTLVVHRSGSVVEAVGASMSIPGLAAPLARGGRLLVDGGVLNNLPVDAMADAREGPIVAVDVIRRIERDGGEKAPLPSIMETLTRATVLASVERAAANRALALVVVSPEVQDVGLREFRALDRAVEAGRRAAREALDAGGREAIERATGPLD